MEVRKSQHKYVIGPKGSNLSEILAQYDVSVEVPPLDSTSETITLRGDQVRSNPRQESHKIYISSFIKASKMY